MSRLASLVTENRNVKLPTLADISTIDGAKKAAMDQSIVVRRHYDAILPLAVYLPTRSRLRLALDLIIGVPVLGALWLLSVARRV